MLRLLRTKFLAALAALTATAAVASAQAWEWTNYTGVGINWSTAGNWTPVGPPASATNTVLTFGFAPPNTVPPFAFAPTGNYASNNDTATPFVLNGMVFNGTGANNISSNGIVINSTVAAGGISFQGTNPFITQNGTGSVTFANSTATTDLAINGSLTVNGGGFGHVTLAGVIGGTGNLVISHTGTSPLLSGGQIFLSPGAANTFAGNIVLNSGNLAVTTTNALFAAGGQIVVNGGTLRGTAAFTIPATTTVVLNSQLVVTGLFAPTFASPVTGNGGIRIAPTASIVATFANTISGTGAILVEGLGTAAPALTLSSQSGTVHGTALNATAYTVNFGTLAISNTVANVARLNSAATLTLNNGSLTISGGTTAISEAVASTTLGGNTQFTLTPPTAAPLTFNAGALTRTGNATIQVTTQGTGLTLGGTPGTNGNATLLLGGVTPANNIGGVLPWGFALATQSTVAVGTLVRYDATNGVVPLSLATDYNTSAAPSLGGAPASNQLASSVAGGPLNGTRTVNSLTLASASAAAFGSTVGTNGLAANVTLTSGVLATVITGGTTASTLPTILKPNFALPVTGYFHTQNNTALVGSVSGSAGLVKSGTGTLSLYGDNSGLTGGLTVNSGNLNFTRDVNLGAPGAGVILNLGQGGGFLAFNSLAQFAPVASATLAINRPLTLETAGGGGLSASQSNTTLQWDGAIGGGGRLVKTGPGVLVLNGANTFTGDVAVNQGYLVANSDAALGAAGNSIIMNNGGNLGGLQFGPGFTSTNRNILITSISNSTLLNTPTDFTLNGQIVGNQTATVLFKIGAGNLTATGVNTHNGLLVVGNSTPLRIPSHPFAEPGGTLTLSGANGSFAGATGFSIQTSTLHLDNTAAVNSNRAASAGVTLFAGEFKLTGNAGASVAEHVGVSAATGLTASAHGNTVTLSQPAGVGGSRNTTLAITGYSEGVATAITFFRGDNLGGTAGDTTNIRFVAAPTLVGGIIRSGLYANSATAAPQDFATHSVANGIERFTAYTNLPSTGATNPFVYSASAPTTFIAAQDTNALKVTDAAIDLAGFNLGITGAGALLVTGTGVSSIVTTSGAPDLAFGATAPARITVNTTLTVGSAANPVRITGSVGLNKFGPGTLEVSSTNIITPVSISQGTYRTLSPAAVPTGSLYFIQPGATLDFNGLGTVAVPVGSVSLAGFGTVNIGAGALSVGASAVAFGGSLSGSGTLIVGVATGAQTLNGNSPAFSGGVQILAGTLAIDANVDPAAAAPGPLGTGTTPLQLGNTTGTSTAALTLGTNLTVFNRPLVVPAGVPSAAAVFQIAMGAGIANFNGAITISRDLRITGGGAAAYVNFNGVIADGTAPGRLDWFNNNMNLNGNNTFTGGIFVEATSTSILGLGHDNAAGTGPIVIANQVSTGGFRADNGHRTIANPFDYEAGATANSIGFTGDNNLTFTAANVSLLSSATSITRTWSVYGTGLATFTGNLTQTGGGAASLTKLGGGTLVLGGANTFTGALAISGGTVRITNTTGSGTGVTNTVTINSGGRLEGTGTALSSITLAAGGTIAGGTNNVGKLSYSGAFTGVAGSFINVGISAPGLPAAASTGGSSISLPNPTNNNYIEKTGGLGATGLSTMTILIDLNNISFPTMFVEYSYAIGGGWGDQSALNVTAASQFSFYNVPAGVTIANVSFTGTNPGGITENLFLNFTPTPEPAVMLGAALVGVLALRRRNKA